VLAHTPKTPPGGAQAGGTKEGFSHSINHSLTVPQPKSLMHRKIIVAMHKKPPYMLLINLTQ
jgi:hypothetical protein